MRLKREARHAGFSAHVGKQVTFSRRASTQLAYQAKWSVYRRWCSSKVHSVSRPSVPKVADFLPFLWKERKLSLSAVKGYRSMLSSVFRSRLPEVSSHPMLRDLLRSFSIERPRVVSSFPSWDLDVVLRSLMFFLSNPCHLCCWGSWQRRLSSWLLWLLPREWESFRLYLPLSPSSAGICPSPIDRISWPRRSLPVILSLGLSFLNL